MNITCIVFGAIFVITGILFYFGLLLSTIKAWKNMPIEEKQKVKIKPLCHNIGIIIGLSGVIFLFAGFIPVFKEKYFIYAMLIWLVIAGLDAYWIIKTKRYQG